MTAQHQHFSDSHSLGIGNGDFPQPGKRASLLAGLRTGGPRASSPGPAFGQDQYSNNGAYNINGGFVDHAAQLKATAAVFTPRSNSNSPPGSPDHDQPGMHGHGQGVSANERLALMQQHHAQHQQIQNAQAQLAALYGANQGQTHQQSDYGQQQHHDQLLLHQQKNAQQLMQNQFAVQQQMQLEMLRLQAMQQQQAQQQQVQAQQRALLARIHAEYERQAQIAAVTKRQEELQEQLRLQQRHQEDLAQQAAIARIQQQQQQHGSAREQRQAAQASIQASLRNRRDEQMHAQQQQQQMLLQQFHLFNGDGGATSFEDAQLRFDPTMQHANSQSANALTQHQQHELEQLMRSCSLAKMEQERLEEEHAQQAQAQAQAAAVQQMQRTHTPPSSTEANGPRLPSAQPGQEGQSNGTGNNNKQRDRMSSHADASASWRSSLGASSGAAALRKNSNTPPAIVIDDSDSDYSVSRSSIDGLGSLRQRASNGGRSGLANVKNNEFDTPETSEDDLNNFMARQQKSAGLSKVSSDVPAVLPSGQLNTKPTNVIRSSALAGLLGNVVASQRTRSDSAGGAASLPARPVLALNGVHTGNGRTPSPPVDSLLLGSGGPSMSSGSNGGNSSVLAPRRQPKGPPTEFLAHNFASRISVRTRREAMSKLCASPRASVLSFANVGLPRATAA